MKKTVAILDYGAGNVRSAHRAVERLGVTAEITSDPKAVLQADGLLVPGVGAFDACMSGLKKVYGPRLIGERLAGSRPVLGICVGMQVLFAHGVEHGVESAGLEEWPGTVERLQAEVLPHMGWNTVDADPDMRMFSGLDSNERFYFVHSYGVRTWEMKPEGAFIPPRLAWSEHQGDRFVAAVENGPLWATQFHPEKSGDAGAVLLRNWVDTL